MQPRCGHGYGHEQTATQSNQPSSDFYAEPNRVATVIAFDPCPCINYSSGNGIHILMIFFAGFFTGTGSAFLATGFLAGLTTSVALTTTGRFHP